MTHTPITHDPVTFDEAESYDERFEFAQYVINTPPEDRPEVTDADAEAALTWWVEVNS